MTNKLLRGLSMTIAGAAILGSIMLQAAGHRSDPVEIPFDFTVQGKQLPAGTYRLQKGTSAGFSALVNLRTGKSVQILRAVGATRAKPSWCSNTRRTATC